MKSTDVWAVYKEYIHKSKTKHCPVIAYWSQSGDLFGLPPELSILLKKNPRLIRLEHSKSDVYYTAKIKNTRGSAPIKTDQDPSEDGE